MREIDIRRNKYKQKNVTHCRKGNVLAVLKDLISSRCRFNLRRKKKPLNSIQIQIRSSQDKNKFDEKSS